MAAGLFPVANPDTFGHLAAGRQIAAEGQVPRVDTISFWKPTPQPWTNYEWLSALILWEVYAHFSYNGLIFFKLALLALVAGFLLRRAFLSGGDLGTVLCSLLLIAAIPAVRFRLTERPHLWGMVFAAIFLCGLWRVSETTGALPTSSRAGRWIAGLTITQLFWVNLHGSNLLGVTMTGIYLIAHLGQPKATRRLALLLGLQLAVSCVSPFGPAILTDAIRHVLDPQYRQVVSEWAPWNDRNPAFYFFAPIVQSALFALMVPFMLRQGARGWASMGVVLLLAIMAFRSIRFVGEYMLLSSPLLAEQLAERLRAWPKKRLIWTLLPLGIALLVIAPVSAAPLPPALPMGLGSSTRELPAGSAAWLGDAIANPRVLAAMEDSWYLTFALPQARVLLDGRVPFYGPEHVRMVASAYRSPPRLRQLLDHYRVDTVVVRHVYRGHRQVLQTMRELSNWRLVMIENAYATFTRYIPRRQALIDRRALRSLVPSYDIELFLSPHADLRAIDRELAMIARYPNTGLYRDWVIALLSLRPLARAGGRAGLRPPETYKERASVSSALLTLRAVAAAYPDVPTVCAAYAMSAVAACQLTEARDVVKKAEAEEASRETLLLGQEIALRQGSAQSVRAFLDKAYAMPLAQNDPWLAALSDGLNRPPRCP
jgi:hypothetical protein